MADHREPLERFAQDRLDLSGAIAAGARRLEPKRQIDLAAIDPGRDGMARDAGPEPRESLADGRAGADVSRGHVLDVEGDVVHRASPFLRETQKAASTV
jgi:hypothetical protein